jgi:protein-S-isoprenylcysteine O-methyltransferase Ste14
MNNPSRFLLRVPVPWVFVLAYLMGIIPERGRSSYIPARLAEQSTLVGAVLFSIGVIIAGWALLLFRKARTTTVPGKSSNRLVTWGPYRFTRNPMYVALTLAYIGEAGLLHQVWPLVLLPLVLAYVNWTVIPLEESKLKEVFVDDYEQYRLRVRRWI